MARPLLVASSALWLSFGCLGGQSGAEGPSGAGEPIGPGGSECEQSTECRDALASELERLAQPAPLSVEIVASRCERINISNDFDSISGNACSCESADAGLITIGPAGLGCHVLGRDGQCILSDTDFTTCDESDPSACTAVCEEAAQRIEADSARPVATELILAECRQGACQSVASLDGQCYANGGWQRGEPFDCSLGAEAILEAAADANAPPTLTPVADDQNSYRVGTSAMLRLHASADWYGSERAYTGFGVFAQFFQVDEGTPAEQLDVIDPLDGIDDCGIVRRGSSGTSPSLEFSSVDRAVLRDADTGHVLEEFQSGTSAFPFYSYGADLLGAGAAPRYGESYGFSASGGSSNASIDIDGIVLPEALSLPALESLRRYEQGALDLTWQGRGSAPLRISLAFYPILSTFGSSLSIECLLQDDGAFTLPSEVLAAAPEGLVLATFRRENRSVVSSGGKSIQTVAAVSVNHRFVLGPACDGRASMTACQASADAVAASYTACGVEPPPTATLCPDYLNEACHTCPEYFECIARETRCDESGLQIGMGCSCP